MDYLYHYTSLETLALILTNHTICFNNLLYVDDVEEAETKDMGRFGRFVYVSCWTDDKTESIPLWNMYTPNMHGVRIRMKKFPFKRYHFSKNEMFCTEDVDSFINLKKIYDENKMSIVADLPKLEKIQYSDLEEDLFPQVKIESYNGATEDFLKAKCIEDVARCGANVEYSLRKLGKYKRTNWKFQREWRYIITALPMGMQEQSPVTFEKQKEYIRRIEDLELDPPYKQIFLELSEDVFKDIEIMLGPKMTLAEKIITKALVEKYCPKARCVESALMIK